MQTLTVKSLQANVHPQIKVMFWFLFASSKGAFTRIKIVNLLRKQPYNANQISKELTIDYKAIKHHLILLEKNSLLEKFSIDYGGTYYPSALFEENYSIFDEIISKMNL